MSASERAPRHGFFSNKGGSHKTTLAVQWACAQARSGRTVALVDFDGQGNATDRMRAADPDRAAIGDVIHLRNPQPITNAMTLSAWEMPDGSPSAESERLYVIQGSLSLNDREGETQDPRSIFRLRKALDELDCARYGIDAIGIDFAPAANHSMYMGLAALNDVRDRLWLPATPNEDDVQGVIRVCETVALNRDILGLHESLIGGVIMSGIKPRLRRNREYLSTIRDRMSTAANGEPVRVLESVIPDMEVIRIASNDRLPLTALTGRDRTTAREAIEHYDYLSDEMNSISATTN